MTALKHLLKIVPEYKKNPDILKEITEQIKGNKIHYSSFDIKPMNIKIDENDIIFTTQLGIVKSYWIEVGEKNSYNHIIENLWYCAQCEIGDFHPYRNDPKYYHYIFAFPCMLKGYIPSDKYKALGICTIDGHTNSVFLCWMHPYLRDKGVMSQFLSELFGNTPISNITLPMSDEMECCADKAMKILFSNSSYRENFVKNKTIHLIELGFPEDLLSNKDDVINIFALYSSYLAHGLDKKMPPEKMVDAILTAYHVQKEYETNPEFKKEFDDLAPKIDRERFERNNYIYRKTGVSVA